MPQLIKIAGDNLTLDLVLYRRDGRRGQDLVRATYRLNPGLAAVGPILPVGREILLPDPLPEPRPGAVQPVSLFD